MQVEATITERNQKRIEPYKSFLPSRIPNSTDIWAGGMEETDIFQRDSRANCVFFLLA